MAQSSIGPVIEDTIFDPTYLDRYGPLARRAEAAFVWGDGEIVTANRIVSAFALRREYWYTFNAFHGWRRELRRAAFSCVGVVDVQVASS